MGYRRLKLQWQNLFKISVLKIGVILFLLGYFYHLKSQDSVNSCSVIPLNYKEMNTSKEGNTTNFFLHNPKHLCRTNTKAKMRTVLIVVHTARDHYQARDVIRKTFGSVKTFQSWHFVLAFILGTPKDRKEPNPYMLNIEIKKFGDIVIADFVDTYRNLSLKHLVALKWATEYCSSAEFYIKTDDDYLVEIFRATTLMAKIPLNDSNYYCMKIVKWTPYRNKSSRYVLTREEYAPNVFPTFCLGLYITRMETIRRVHATAASGEVKIMPMEDVFVTGIIRVHINRKIMIREHINQMLMEQNRTPIINSDKHVKRIGIVNEVMDHAQTYPRLISLNFKNSSYIEIYTQGKGSRACLIWDAVLRNHGLFEKLISC